MDIKKIPETFDKLDLPEFDIWEYLSLTKKPVVIYGMGNGADKIADELLKFSLEPAGYFASDEFVRGQSFRGRRVMTYSEAERKFGDFIVLVAFGTRLDPIISRIIEISQKHELYVPDVPVAGDEVFTLSFAQSHMSELVEAYNAFEDTLSRSLYLSMINYKLTGKLEYLLRFTSTFNEILSEFNTESWHRIADLGAYTGDTLKQFDLIANNLESAVALEPDSKNFKKLCAEANFLKCNIEAYNMCAWSGTCELSFVRSGNRNSTVAGLSHMPSAKSAASKLIKADSLDNILNGRSVDFIKFDVEGSECEALEGCRKTLDTYSPELLMSVYHKSEDIFTLPLKLKVLLPTKRMLLRRCRCLPAWELNVCLVD